MTDNSGSDAASELTISDDLRKKYPDLVELADIDKKYGDQIGSASEKELIEKTEASIVERREARSEKEEEHERKEDVQTEELLNKIDQL